MLNIATKFEGIYLKHHKLITPLKLVGPPRHYTTSSLTLTTGEPILSLMEMMIVGNPRLLRSLALNHVGCMYLSLRLFRSNKTEKRGVENLYD